MGRGWWLVSGCLLLRRQHPLRRQGRRRRGRSSPTPKRVSRCLLHHLPVPSATPGPAPKTTLPETKGAQPLSPPNQPSAPAVAPPTAPPSPPPPAARPTPPPPPPPVSRPARPPPPAAQPCT